MTDQDAPDYLEEKRREAPSAFTVDPPRAHKLELCLAGDMYSPQFRATGIYQAVEPSGTVVVPYGRYPGNVRLVPIGHIFQNPVAKLTSD